MERRFQWNGVDTHINLEVRRVGRAIQADCLQLATELPLRRQDSTDAGKLIELGVFEVIGARERSASRLISAKRANLALKLTVSS